MYEWIIALGDHLSDMIAALGAAAVEILQFWTWFGNS